MEISFLGYYTYAVNMLSGAVTASVAAYLAFGPGADAASIKGAALTLLIIFTYLWLAYNRFHDVDGRGLGWYSLFIAITVVPVALITWSEATSLWGVLVWRMLGRMGRIVVHVLPAPGNGKAPRQGNGSCNIDTRRTDRLAAGLPSA